jgi:hypothetical protein
MLEVLRWLFCEPLRRYASSMISDRDRVFRQRPREAAAPYIAIGDGELNRDLRELRKCNPDQRCVGRQLESVLSKLGRPRCASRLSSAGLPCRKVLFARRSLLDPYPPTLCVAFASPEAEGQGVVGSGPHWHRPSRQAGAPCRVAHGGAGRGGHLSAAYSEQVEEWLSSAFAT